MLDLIDPFRRIRIWKGAISAIIFLPILGIVYLSGVLKPKPPDNYGWHAYPRWSGGTLLLDLSYERADLATNHPIKVLWVAVDGISSDELVSAGSAGGSLMVPFSKYTGVGGTKSTIDIRYRMDGDALDMDQYLKVDLPAKGAASQP